MNAIYQLNNKFEIACIGFLFTLAFPPFDLIFCGLLSLYILFSYLNEAKDIKNVSVFGYIFGFSHLFTSLYWVGSGPLLEYENSSEKMYLLFSILSSVAIPMILASFYLLLSVSFYYLKSIKFYYYNVFLFGILFSFFEYLRGYLLAPFPWNNISIILHSNQTFLQIISLINIYEITSLIAIFSILIFHFLLKIIYKKIFNLKDILIIYLSMLSLFSMNLYGENRIKNYHKNFKNKSITDIDTVYHIFCLQTNFRSPYNLSYNEAIEKLEKISSLIEKKNLQNYIILLPESSLQIESYIDGNLSSDLKKTIGKLSKDNFVIAGGDFFNKNSYYNSIAVIKNYEIIYRYDKKILVPFGEYMPLKSIINSISPLTSKFLNGFSFGKNSNIININNTKFALIVCYESIFDKNYRDILEKEEGISAIINLTNDIWIENTSGFYQHFAHAKLRAVEYNTSFIRLSNNGISGVINPVGEVIYKTKKNIKTSFIVKAL